MSTPPLARAVIGVAGVLVVSRLLGFVREVVIAHRFGTSAEYDLYLVAIMFSALAYGILNYAGYYLFVPYLTRKITLAQQQGSEPESVWPLVNLAVVAAVVTTVALVLLAPLVLRLWTSNFLAAEYDQVVFYSRVTAAAVILGVGEAFMRALLNVKRIYTYPAGGYIVFNLCSIASIFFLADTMGVGAIALGWIGGLLIQNIYLALRLAGAHPMGTYRAVMLNEETKFLVTTAGALVVIELINRSYFLIDRFFAPLFGEGVISSLNYSQVLVQLPDSIIGFAIGAVVFPIFSARSGEEDRDRFWALYRRSVTAAFLLAVPIAGAMFVVAPEMIYLLFQRGEFDPASTAMTVAVLRPYLPSLIALFLVSLSIRACYSGGWVRAVFWAAFGVFSVKLLATAMLSEQIGYQGISAATSLAEVGFALLLVGTVVYRMRPHDGGAFVWVMARILGAGVLAVIAGMYARSMLVTDAAALTRNGAAVSLLAGAVLTTVLYWLLGMVMGLGTHFREFVKRPAAAGMR